MRGESKSSEVELLPNSIGVFIPRPTVDPGAAVAIEVAYPQGTPGEVVVASVQDGGDLADRKAVQTLTLSNERKISFNFFTGANEGIYHISVQKGVDRKMIEVWAGPEIPIAD